MYDCFRPTVHQEGVVQAIPLHHEAGAGFREQLPGEGCRRTAEEGEDRQHHPDDRHQHIQPEGKTQEIQGQRYIGPCTTQSPCL